MLGVFPSVGQRATNDGIPAAVQELKVAIPTVIGPAETLAHSECAVQQREGGKAIKAVRKDM